jgi:hypothetical protein
MRQSLGGIHLSPHRQDVDNEIAVIQRLVCRTDWLGLRKSGGSSQISQDNVELEIRPRGSVPVQRLGNIDLNGRGSDIGNRARGLKTV